MSTVLDPRPTHPPELLEHVRSLWDEAVAARLDGVDRLVYRSNRLGGDPMITNTGGGNTSSKLIEREPITGAEVEVLWVKGSGGDLRTAGREHFSSLYQAKLVSLQRVYASMSPRGPKTAAEDAMVGLYAHCTFNLNPRPPSIDTPLHAFVPYKHVDHMHPVPCIAIATAKEGPALTREVFGDEVVWLDWQRPGFELGLELERVCREHPNARGAILGKHGLINWADDDRECYLLTLSLIDRAEAFFVARRGAQEPLTPAGGGEQGGPVPGRAWSSPAPGAAERAPRAVFGGARFQPLPEPRRRAVLADVLPWLRGRVSRERRMIATAQTDGGVLDFACSNDAPRLAALGTSCPDHFLRTRIKPLFVDWDPRSDDVDALRANLAAGLDAYRHDYVAYYEACKHPDAPAMRGSDPTVVLVPGIGMIAWGRTKSESRVTAEFYNAAVAVLQRAERVSEYTALPRQEAFDIEYWPLEQAKLERMPPEKELAREIAVVVGAGSGIGRTVVERLVREGAVVAAIDLDADAARDTAHAILDRVGLGIGVAGTGLAASGDVIGLGADITYRASVRAALEHVILAYGGLDHVIITAGLYPSPDRDGRVADPRWADTFAVNVTGPFLVAEEAARVWRAQGLSGSLVIATSVNAVVAKKGSFAYDTSKAAANHLVRELAVALAPLVRVNAVAPAAVVEGSAMFPRERVIASLEKYEIEYGEDEGTDMLRERLAEYYAARSLTHRAVTSADAAEAVFLLVSRRLGKSTGQILNIDGGLYDAFLR